MTTTTKIDKLVNQLNNLHKEIFQEIERLHPIGSLVQFFIMSSQKIPSTGKVTGYRSDRGGPVVVVFHHQAKKGSRYKYRSVSLKSIIGATA